MRGPRSLNLAASLPTALACIAVLLRLTACTDSVAPNGPAEATPPSFDAASSSYTLVGAADIASCSMAIPGDERTAALINGVLAADPSATVFAAGDVAYNSATATDFTNCYEPTWGQFKARTRPALGNHEYDISTNPYFDYYNGVGSDSGVAGKRGSGYYSYDLGNWHIIVLNSNGTSFTAANSAQNAWLKVELDRTSQPCVLAYWHHARFASGVNDPAPVINAAVKPFWDNLFAARADVVLVGHQHFYERFAPQTPDGILDSQNGIRQFLVGTGGKSKGGTIMAIAPNSEVRDIGTFGVLKLSLNPSGYDWQFLPELGFSFTDTGSGTCHPKHPTGNGQIVINAGGSQSGVVATNVIARPTVKVTDAAGNALANVGVTFAVATGGGSITGPSQTTNPQGIARVNTWTLGKTAGGNPLTATTIGFAGSPVTFNATGTPGPASAGSSTATVPNGTAGSATSISVQAKDQYGNSLTSGGAAVVVTVSGANTATPVVTDNANGTYTASYTPAAAGSDQVAITLGGSAISGSPYPSTVAGGAATAIALNGGNNQSATVNTAVATAPSVKVNDGGGEPGGKVGGRLPGGPRGGGNTRAPPPPQTHGEPPLGH